MHEVSKACNCYVHAFDTSTPNPTPYTVAQNPKPQAHPFPHPVPIFTGKLRSLPKRSSAHLNVDTGPSRFRACRAKAFGLRVPGGTSRPKHST